MDLAEEQGAQNAENLPENRAKGAYNSSPLLTENVQTWAFGDMLVRTIQLGGEPFFVAKDIAAALDYPRAQNFTQSLDSERPGAARKCSPSTSRACTMRFL